MERKTYLELCQKNSLFPKSVMVEYGGAFYYPKGYLLWFDDQGITKHSALMTGKMGKHEIRCLLEDVKECKLDNCAE
jgi:hypothetical protein